MGEPVLSRGRGVKKLKAGQPLIRCSSLSQAVVEVSICPPLEAGGRSPSLITVPRNGSLKIQTHASELKEMSAQL